MPVVDYGLALQRSADTLCSALDGRLHPPARLFDLYVDAGPYICGRLRPLVLSDPMVISGPVAGGQTVTVQLTLDFDGAGDET